MKRILLPFIIILLMSGNTAWAGGLFPGTAGVSDAKDVKFDNTEASLTGDPDDVQGAIEAAKTEIDTIGKIKARAYLNAEQNIEPDSTKVLIDTISFDTEGVVDIANSRIIPNLPGYYIVMGNVRADAVPDGQRVNAMIYKNGELVTYGTSDYQGARGLSSSTASDLIYMNGTTDYLELFANNNHSSALDLYTGRLYQNYLSILGPF